jgi:hypothetical protein
MRIAHAAAISSLLQVFMLSYLIVYLFLNPDDSRANIARYVLVPLHCCLLSAPWWSRRAIHRDSQLQKGALRLPSFSAPRSMTFAEPLEHAVTATQPHHLSTPPSSTFKLPSDWLKLFLLAYIIQVL